MARLEDYDFKKESLNQREFNDDVRRLWNNSLYEIKVISTSQPTWTENVSGILVLSVYGGSRTLFISDTTATNGWVYGTLTEL